MPVRWSPDAVADLENIIQYIREDSPAASERVGRAIYERSAMFSNFPYAGRAGRVDGTRELALPPLPYLVVYRVLASSDTVEILNVIHGAERWPPVS